MVDSASDARTVNNLVWHEYRVLTDAEKQTVNDLKDKGRELIKLIDSVGKSQELRLALTNAEQAIMWAVKHVTD